jgi:hypothetical protein
MRWRSSVELPGSPDCDGVEEQTLVEAEGLYRGVDADLNIARCWEVVRHRALHTLNQMHRL